MTAARDAVPPPTRKPVPPAIAKVSPNTLQPVHASRTYVDAQILFLHRFVDILSERADGRLILDIRKFNDVVKQ